MQTFICYTGNGSITSRLLAAKLEKIDDFGLSERNELLRDPFLLLDGHGSLLDLPFQG
jgi:hypothetical protein